MRDTAAARSTTGPRHRASGRVVVAMLLWSCAACGASGAVPGEKIPLLADYATSKASFEMTPETVVRRFEGLAPLTQSGTPDNLWEFTGRDAGGGILWAVVQFQRTGEDPGSGGGPAWELLQADVGLAPVDSGGDDTFRRLCGEIAMRLKQPQTSCDADDGKLFAWSLGPYLAGRLEEGDLENPVTRERMHAVDLTLTILQGDEE